MWRLLTNGDEHRNEEKATSTMRTALLGWPDRARACCGELRRRRAPGGVNGVETRMVAKFGTLRQAGKQARDQQRLERVAVRVGRMPARLDERGHRVNSDLMPT